MKEAIRALERRWHGGDPWAGTLLPRPGLLHDRGSLAALQTLLMELRTEFGSYESFTAQDGTHEALDRLFWRITDALHDSAPTGQQKQASVVKRPIHAAQAASAKSDRFQRTLPG